MRHSLLASVLEAAATNLKHTEQVRLFEIYEPLRLERGLVTLDDCINLPVRLLRERPDVAAILRSEIRHAVVDEFQDWNRAQIELLSQLFPRRADGGGPDVCVVGDDDQSIFGFRGADTRAFERFSERPDRVPVDLDVRQPEPFAQRPAHRRFPRERQSA